MANQVAELKQKILDKDKVIQEQKQQINSAISGDEYLKKQITELENKLKSEIENLNYLRTQKGDMTTQMQGLMESKKSL